MKNTLLYLFLFSFLLVENLVAGGLGEIIDDSTAYVAYTTPRGLGYRKGYTSIGYLTTAQRYFLSDLRFHTFDSGRFAMNVGLGVRYPHPDQNVVYGANIFYDYRDTSFDYYQQMGVGIEVLGCQIDFRANGYIPFGRDHSKFHKRTFGFPGGFLAVSRDREFRFWGGDAELGMFLPGIPLIRKYANFYVAAGPYYLRSQSYTDFFGGRLRLAAFITDYIRIEGRLTHDAIFHTRGQGVISFQIPLTKLFAMFTGSSCREDCCYEPCEPESCYVPIFRNEIIPVKDRCRWQCNYNCF